MAKGRRSRTKKNKKTAFVPRAVLVAFAGASVVPACVSACGSDDAPNQAADCRVGSCDVAEAGFGTGGDVAGDAFSDRYQKSDRGWGGDVADTGFAVADNGFGDVNLGDVADVGFGG
jgi:hypothetical protein